MGLELFSDGAEGLTFDDVLIVPGYSEVLPSEVDISAELVPGIRLKAPVLSAAMDTVTDSRLAIAIARIGGIGIITVTCRLKHRLQKCTKSSAPSQA